MKTLVTDSARRQLRTATVSVHRRDRGRAKAFRDDVAALLDDPDRVESRAQPLADLPDLPFREVRIDGYRLFFRTASGVLWLAGVWETPLEG